MSEKKDEIIDTAGLYKKLDEITKDFDGTKNKLQTLMDTIQEHQKQIEEKILSLNETFKWTRFQPEYLKNFVEEPYVIEPSRMDKKGSVLEWHVFVPKIVQFSVGRLERATHSYNVYSVTQYMRHFAEIPEELLDRFPKLDIELKVVDGLLLTEEKQTEAALVKYRSYIYRKEGPGKLKIKKGSEWELIAKILEDGGLPFEPQQVDENDLRTHSYEGFAGVPEWKIRDYQQEALNRFKEYGAIGIYWPFGCGKSEFGLDLIDQLKGPKLVVVSTLSLKETWEERLKLIPQSRRNEVFVCTYVGQREIDRLIKQYKEFTIVVFDEVHHLPAKTFMRLSTIPTKYRLGLTGSPYREDGHINYILALTGYPMGLAWSKFIAEGIIKLAQVQVHVVRKASHKISLLDDLLKRDLGKTIIFSDSLDLGEDIAKKYGFEWIHGATRNRIDTIQQNQTVVVSRVGDEGISIPTLDTIIEVDFLGGSRAQALQRIGRLQHREIKTEQQPAVHHIIMTEEELEKYGKRLLAYYDKGYKVDYLYHT